MSPKEEALRLLDSLPGDCTWEQVIRSLSARAESERPGWRVRELQGAYAANETGNPSPTGAEESEMRYQGRITIEPGKRSGKPCVRGLRITVSDVLDYLASGMTEDEILADFPDLERADIRACLSFAADRERRLLTIPA